METFRMVITFAVLRDWELKHIDYIAAYLNATAKKRSMSPRQE